MPSVWSPKRVNSVLNYMSSYASSSKQTIRLDIAPSCRTIHSHHTQMGGKTYILEHKMLVRNGVSDWSVAVKGYSRQLFIGGFWVCRHGLLKVQKKIMQTKEGKNQRVRIWEWLLQMTWWYNEQDIKLFNSLLAQVDEWNKHWTAKVDLYIQCTYEELNSKRR